MTTTFLPQTNPNDILNCLFNETRIKIEGKIKDTDRICRKILEKLSKANIKNVSYNINKGEISLC